MERDSFFYISRSKWGGGWEAKFKQEGFLSQATEMRSRWGGVLQL